MKGNLEAARNTPVTTACTVVARPYTPQSFTSAGPFTSDICTKCRHLSYVRPTRALESGNKSV